MPPLIDILTTLSEVFALLIPLVVILREKPKGPSIEYMSLYVFIALPLNAITAALYIFYNFLPKLLQGNGYLYNISSLVRVLFFSLFIYYAPPYQFKKVHRIILGVYFVFGIINFLFIQSFNTLSNIFVGAEGLVILFLCVLYFISAMDDDSEVDWFKEPFFRVCAVMGLYESVKFITYLFIYVIAVQNNTFNMITLYSDYTAFVIFCIVLAKAAHTIALRNKQTGLTSSH